MDRIGPSDRFSFGWFGFDTDWFGSDRFGSGPGRV